MTAAEIRDLVLNDNNDDGDVDLNNSSYDDSDDVSNHAASDDEDDDILAYAHMASTTEREAQPMTPCETQTTLDSSRATSTHVGNVQSVLKYKQMSQDAQVLSG